MTDQQVNTGQGAPAPARLAPIVGVADSPPVGTRQEMIFALAKQSPAMALLAFFGWIAWELAQPLADALPKCIGTLPT